jgi:hypothetical protein
MFTVHGKNSVYRLNKSEKSDNNSKKQRVIGMSSCGEEFVVAPVVVGNNPQTVILSPFLCRFFDALTI